MNTVRLNYAIITLSLCIGVALSFDLSLPREIMRLLGVLSFCLIAWVAFWLRPSNIAPKERKIRLEARQQVFILVAIGGAGLFGSIEMLLADTGLREFVVVANLAAWLLGLGALYATATRLWRLTSGG